LWVQAQINDYKISIWWVVFLVAKYAALKIKSKDWLAQNHDNVSYEEEYVYLLTLSKLALYNSNYGCLFSTKWTSSSSQLNEISSCHMIKL